MISSASIFLPCILHLFCFRWWWWWWWQPHGHWWCCLLLRHILCQSEQFFMSNLAAWPGHQQKPAQQPAAQPKPAGQGGGNEVPHCMFLWWFKTIFCAKQLWLCLHLALAPLTPHHFLQPWFGRHEGEQVQLQQKQQQRRKGWGNWELWWWEARNASTTQRGKAQSQRKWQGSTKKPLPTPLHLRDGKKNENENTSWVQVVKGGKWEKNKINDRCHKMAMHALKRAIHALRRAMGFGLQALKRAVASNPFFWTGQQLKLLEGKKQHQNSVENHGPSYGIIWHHMMGGAIIWWQKPIIWWQKPIIWWEGPSYDAIWWLLFFLAPACPRWKSHIFKKKKIGHDKSNAAFFQAQGFLWQKIGRALQRAAVHNGKGNESHEKP